MAFTKLRQKLLAEERKPRRRAKAQQHDHHDERLRPGHDDTEHATIARLQPALQSWLSALAHAAHEEQQSQCRRQRERDPE